MLGYGLAGAVSPYLGVVLPITSLLLSNVERGILETPGGASDHSGMTTETYGFCGWMNAHGLTSESVGTSTAIT